MKIAINKLPSLQPLEKVVIHSLECALYSVTVFIDGKEKVVTDEKGKNLSKHSVMEIRELFEPIAVKEMVLRQQSPYDEMVGQPPKPGGNALEVTLGKELYPPVRTLN